MTVAGSTERGNGDRIKSAMDNAGYGDSDMGRRTIFILGNAKAIIGKRNGWGSFKHSLMDRLGIPANLYDKWDVPVEWQYAYRRATGWSAKDARRQLRLPSPSTKQRGS